MTDLPQRWLSLNGLISVLHMDKSTIRRLIRKGFLQRIGDSKRGYRYLDPSPLYAEKMRLALGLDPTTALETKGLLTIREVAEIMGWSLRYARGYMAQKCKPVVKGRNKTALYSVAAVRDMLWRRNGKRLGKYQGPVLLSEMIIFFQRFHAAEDAVMPTDAEFKADAALEKKITWILKQPESRKLLAEFLEKIELAKRIVPVQLVQQSRHES